MAGSYSARSALMAPLHWPTLPPPRTPVPGQEEEAAVLTLLPGSGGMLWGRGAMQVGPVLPASRVTDRAGLHGGDDLAEACNQGSRSIREVLADPHSLRDSWPGLGTQGARADPAGDPFQH